MSIIRSNIARQLLAEGGAPRKPFANGGFDYESAAAFGNDMGMTSSPGSGEESGGDLDEGFAARDAFFTPTKSRFQTVKDNLTDRFITTPRMNRINRGLLTNLGAIKSAVGLRDIPPELLETLAEDYTGVIGDQARNQKGLFSEGMVGSDISLENAASTLEGLQGLGVDLTGDIKSQVGDLSNTAFASRFGPKTKDNEGGDNEPIKKLIQPTIKKEEPRENTFDDILQFYGTKFAGGGEVRQNYGLGSIVKKAVGAVKKVVKSPIGKAAILGFGLKFAKPDLFANVFAKDSFLMKNKGLSGILAASLASGLYAKKDEEEEELPTVSNTDPEFQKYLAFYGGPRRFAEAGGDIDEAPMKDMPQQEMASNPSSFAELNMLSLDLFGRPYDQLNDSEQEILMEYFSKSKDMPERTMAAGGGMMNPNDEMLNLGGNEMDLRGGGFVPLGEYEKKDDVPARLSKNEFVFTADAVRAAGGGSVDRGADLMYKTMKNLENKIA